MVFLPVGCCRNWFLIGHILFEVKIKRYPCIDSMFLICVVADFGFGAIFLSVKPNWVEKVKPNSDLVLLSSSVHYVLKHLILRGAANSSM